MVKEGQRKHSVRNKVNSIKKFYYVLESKDTKDLLKLSHVQIYTLKALASLSKFLGRYDDWFEIVRKYYLKWSKSGKSIAVFRSIFDSGEESKNIQSMIKWIKEVSTVLPHEYKNILLSNTLTDLRSDETQKALYLAKTREKEYLDTDRGLLKHYQFPSIWNEKKNQMIEKTFFTVTSSVRSAKYYS